MLAISKRARLVAACAILWCAGSAAPAQAADHDAYAAAMNYATPAVTIGQGDGLIFHNLDSLAQHDLVGHGGEFGTKLIGAGEDARVDGVEKLQPGTYDFHCTLHSWMKGALTVTAAGASPTPSPGSGAGGADTGNVTPDPVDIWPRASQQPLGPGSWRFYGGDLRNSRSGGKNGPAPDQVKDLGIAWSFHSAEGDFTGTPAVSRNTVVAGTNGGKVFAIDAQTGKQKWAHTIGKTINGSVAINGYRVFVPVAQPNSPRIVALDLRTGERLWDTTIDTQKNADVYGSPVVWHGKVFMGVSAEYGELNDPEVSVRGSVVALDARTGKLRWKTYTVPADRTGGSVWTTPAVDTGTGRLFVGTGNAYQKPAADTTDSVLSINATDGRILDHFQATAGDVWNGTSNVAEGPDHDFGASPNLIEGPGNRPMIGIGQKSGTYWGLDRGTLDPVWNTMTGPPAQVGGIVGSTAYDGERIYGPDTPGGESWALGTDGSHKWVSSDGGPLHFNPTSVANGVVYTADMSGFLTARESGTGVPLAKIPLGAPSWGGVSIAGGSVFVGIGTQGTSGYIAAYRVKTGNEANEPADHWEEEPPPNRDGEEPAHDHSSHDHGQDGAGGDEAEGHHDPGPGGGPLKPIKQRSDRFVPKPAGTVERLSFTYGPYVVPPGHDMNRADLDLPPNKGFMLSVEPAMRRVTDSTEPSHQEAHIHHAHWFQIDPGNKTDNYFKGNAEWVFGNGDEETRGDFRERSAADKNGPEYGEYIPAGKPQPMIYMLHNKTSQPLTVYIVLDVVFQHGSPEEIEAKDHRKHHDVSGVLFGRTFDVPRQADGDGTWEYGKDSGKTIEWTSPIDGTIIGAGGHLHPGGLRVTMENLGSKENPCRDDGHAFGGTTLLLSDVINHNAPLSEDYQTEVTHPGWRAPIHKGDVIRISGTYENKDHAWYTAMTHVGMYIDEKQPPKGRCKPKVISDPKWKPWEGVPNRSWGKHTDPYCGEQYGKDPCDLPESGPAPTEVRTNVVKIANFAYLPGDRGAGGVLKTIPVIKKGEKLTFVNEDQAANIRHSVTTCAWPCNGQYVGNYPLADGVWDSGTLGYDVIDGGTPDPVAQTPAELPAGRYSYFCRVHPFMRGAFKVE